MPQAWIGDDYDSSVKTCLESGCPLVPRRFGGQDGKIGKTKLKPCYAWQGSAKMAFSSMVRKLKRTKAEGKPNPYSLKNAIKKSVRSARMIRVTAIGNAGAMSKEDREELKAEAKKAGLGLLGYLAGFKKYPEWMMSPLTRGGEPPQFYLKIISHSSLKLPRVGRGLYVLLNLQAGLLIAIVAACVFRNGQQRNN